LVCLRFVFDGFVTFDVVGGVGELDVLEVISRGCVVVRMSCVSWIGWSSSCSIFISERVSAVKYCDKIQTEDSRDWALVYKFQKGKKRRSKDTDSGGALWGSHQVGFRKVGGTTKIRCRRRPNREKVGLYSLSCYT
jgi:hypothetical protein